MLNSLSVGAMALTLFASVAIAQDESPAANAQSACVTDNIDWVLPGHFDEAVARSKTEQRLLLIKGVSFGIDVAGAACATKGKW